jgi:A/G-specific adenine glycosylase
MDRHSPEAFNQAIMEFGALQCRPTPDCMSCPLSSSCFAFSRNKTGMYPVKEKKTKVRNRYFNYLLIRHGEYVHLRKRTGNDIWKNLYDLPLIETTGRISTDRLLRSPEWKNHFPQKGFHLLSESRTVKHQLSHQTIFAKFFEVSAMAEPEIDGIRRIHKDNIHRFAVPRLIENYLASREKA